MTPRRLLRSALLILPASVACSDPCPAGSSRADDGLCYQGAGAGDSGDPSASDGGDGGDDADGGDGTDGWDPSDGFAEGDPILQTYRQGSEAPSGPDGLVEWTDAAMIDSRFAITVGQGGWQIVDLDTGEQVARSPAPRGYRVDSDGSMAGITTRQGQVLRIDVSDPTNPVELSPVFMGGEAANEDVSVDGGNMLVGWTTEGAVFYDSTGMSVATIPANHAFAVGLSGDRAIVTDGDQVVLWDVTNPASAVELDRATTAGEGRDVDFDGGRLLVGMGGYGVDVFDVVDDTLVAKGNLSMPGSALSVALDGEYAWAATWETVVLAWIGGDEPVVLGHQDSSQSAFGVAARDGRAVVADWFFATMLEQVPGVAGPELVLAESHYFQEPGEPIVVPVRNGGLFDLDVSFEIPDGFSLEPSELTLGAGERANVLVTPPADLDRERTEVTVTTNDADEPSPVIKLQLPFADIGSYHDEMSLQGFQLPDTGLETYTLSDNRGKVTLLVYWALF